MLSRSGNEWMFAAFKVNYTDQGTLETRYTDDKKYWLELQEKWPHIQDVVFEDTQPTEEEVERLEEVKGMPTDTVEVYEDYIREGKTDNPFGPNHPFNILLMSKATNKLKSPTAIYEAYLAGEVELGELKALRIGKLKEECSASIYAGFTSGANEFGYNDQDQGNFTKRMVTIVAGAPGPFQWKSKNNGVVELTKDQFTQAVTDAEAHQLTHQQKYWALEADILAAGTVEAVDAVVW